jgi:hypothetical protein
MQAGYSEYVAGTYVVPVTGVQYGGTISYSASMCHSWPSGLAAARLAYGPQKYGTYVRTQ